MDKRDVDAGFSPIVYNLQNINELTTPAEGVEKVARSSGVVERWATPLSAFILQRQKLARNAIKRNLVSLQCMRESCKYQIYGYCRKKCLRDIQIFAAVNQSLYIIIIIIYTYVWYRKIHYFRSSCRSDWLQSDLA